MCKYINMLASKKIYENKIYVSRQSYSEIYEISVEDSQPTLQQIAELQPSLYFLQLDGVLALFKPFQLRLFRNDRWEYHSFTTQLLALRVAGQTVLTFHEKECMAWHLSQDDFSYKYLSESSAPYHLDSDGTIVGYGKKVRVVSKNARLTVCEVIASRWVFVGDDKGSLHVYDWKFLSHVKTFSEHQGPILAINIDESTNTVYFTGSDSKVAMIRLVNDEWKLGQSVRGQNYYKFFLYCICAIINILLIFHQLQTMMFQKPSISIKCPNPTHSQYTLKYLSSCRLCQRCVIEKHRQHRYLIIDSLIEPFKSVNKFYSYEDYKRFDEPQAKVETQVSRLHSQCNSILGIAEDGILLQLKAIKAAFRTKQPNGIEKDLNVSDVEPRNIKKIISQIKFTTFQEFSNLQWALKHTEQKSREACKIIEDARMALGVAKSKLKCLSIFNFELPKIEESFDNVEQVEMKEENLEEKQEFFY